MKYKVSQNKIIIKFLAEHNLHNIYGSVAYKHIKEFLGASVIKGFSGKMKDIAECSDYHRTTIGHFFNHGRWDENELLKLVKSETINIIVNESKTTNKPVFISLDDTVNCKKKPSSQAKLPIESAAFHHSHLLNKRVWGHQVVAAMMNCESAALNFDVHMYDGKQSKIDYVMELSKELPVITDSKSYMLCDSWYTCPKVIEAYENRGYFCIGALKTNRIIYPQGIHISINDFAAEYIKLSDVSLVTVNGHDYYVYRYEGSLNDIENAAVILSYPADAFKNPNALKAFISTDSSLDTQTILEYYTERWCIEVYFKQEKNDLGFNKYQIRSIKGIKRFWILASLTHLLYITGLGAIMPFAQGRTAIRKSVICDTVSYIYNSARNNIPLSVVLDELAV